MSVCGLGMCGVRAKCICLSVSVLAGCGERHIGIGDGGGYVVSSSPAFSLDSLMKCTKLVQVVGVY